MKQGQWRFTVLALLGLLLLAGCQEPREELPVNTRLGGDFTLTDHNGEAFHSDQLHGGLVLLFFGFTQCPDVCPAVLAQVGQTYRVLQEQGLADQVQPVFVTFDPQRDTPEHLREYLPWFKADIIGLTGSEDEIAAVAEQFGVVFIRNEDDDGEYDFSHSDFIYLLDRQSRVRKLYPANFDQDEVINDVQSLL